MSQSRCTIKHLAIAPGATVLQSAACLVAVVCGGSYAVAQAASDNGSGVSGAAAPAGILPFDLLSSLLLMVAAVIGLAVVLFSLGYISPHNREHSSTARRGLYLGWLLAAIGATIGVALAQNLLQLVVFVELLTVCAWGLVSFYGDDASRRAGFKGLLITGTGTVCFIAVLLLLYAGGAPDAFGFDTLFRLEGPLSVAVFVLLLVGVATKAGLFPFFTWVLDATHGPITSIGYLCSGGLGVAIVYMVARLLTANAGMVQQPAVALGLLARLTIIVGIVLLFFYQTQRHRHTMQDRLRTWWAARDVVVYRQHHVNSTHDVVGVIPDAATAGA
jgi:formate hydrogenlyase subunit 3/multisubunit Na+/H+ antiporter MnhD subunit